VLSYFQQLAVITPYASLKLKFAAAEDLGGGASGAEKRSLEVCVSVLVLVTATCVCDCLNL